MSRSWFSLKSGVAFGIVSVLAITGAQAQDVERLARLGKHLAQECTTCHRIDGVDNGIPSIVGLDARTFAEIMGYYRDGQRNNPAMVSVAASLDDEQVRALALYFGQLPKPQPAARKKK